ncbi:MAG: hypothetical protein ACYDCO_26810 [Armatimonadota bacterium]
MKTLMMSILAAIMLIGLAVPALSCGTAANLCGVRPFTQETKYMSLAGYLRWQEYQSQMGWVKWRDAVTMTKEQLMTCRFEMEEMMPQEVARGNWSACSGQERAGRLHESPGLRDEAWKSPVRWSSRQGV